MPDEKPPSERRLLAQRFATFIVANNLANPFGGEVHQARMSYNVAFSVPRLLDGEVAIYSPKFILIRMAGAMSLSGDGRLYASEQEAMDFLRLYLVEHNIEAALAIPVRPPKK